MADPSLCFPIRSSGTPLQNDLLELHALLAFLLPTIFHAGEGAGALAEQVAEVARPVPGAGSGAGQAAQAARAAAQGRLVERMKQLLQPFILRWARGRGLGDRGLGQLGLAARTNGSRQCDLTSAGSSRGESPSWNEEYLLCTLYPFHGPTFPVRHIATCPLEATVSIHSSPFPCLTS